MELVISLTWISKVYNRSPVQPATVLWASRGKLFSDPLVRVTQEPNGVPAAAVNISLTHHDNVKVITNAAETFVSVTTDSFFFIFILTLNPGPSLAKCFKPFHGFSEQN